MWVSQIGFVVIIDGHGGPGPISVARIVDSVECISKMKPVYMEDFLPKILVSAIGKRNLICLLHVLKSRASKFDKRTIQ